MRSLPLSWSLPLASITFVALLVAFLNPSDPGSTAPDVEYVQRVVDGDTLLLGTGERVRLIGVDTPEHAGRIFWQGSERLHQAACRGKADTLGIRTSQQSFGS